MRASVEYIKRMQKDVQRTREVETNFKRMEMANKQLLLRIQVIHTHKNLTFGRNLLKLKKNALRVSGLQGAMPCKSHHIQNSQMLKIQRRLSSQLPAQKVTFV